MASIVLTLARVVILIGRLSHLDKGEQDVLSPERLKTPIFGLCELIRFYSIVYVLITLGCLVAERTLATIKLKNYENYIKDWFFVLSASVQLFLTTLVTTLFYSGVSNILRIGIYLSVGACLGGAVPFILDRINRKRYRESKKYTSCYTLSERYQLAENIRVMKIMKRTIISIIVLNSIILPVFISIYFLKSQLSRKIAMILFNYMIVAYKIIFPIVGILSTEAWKRQIRKPSRVAAFINTDSILQLKTCDGQRMVFTKEEEREIYFTQLFKEWNYSETPLS